MFTGTWYLGSLWAECVFFLGLRFDLVKVGILESLSTLTFALSNASGDWPEDGFDKTFVTYLPIFSVSNGFCSGLEYGYGLGGTSGKYIKFLL